MDQREFQRLKDGLIINLPPAGDDVIESAAARLRARLTASAMFAGVEVETTDDVAQLLVAMVRYRPGTPEAHVSSYLEAVWISELSLPGLDAFHVLAEDGQVELECVTGDQASGYFLSLHLLASLGSAEDFVERPAETVDVVPPKRRWLLR